MKEQCKCGMDRDACEYHRDVPKTSCGCGKGCLPGGSGFLCDYGVLFDAVPNPSAGDASKLEPITYAILFVTINGCLQAQEISVKVTRGKNLVVEMVSAVPASGLEFDSLKVAGTDEEFQVLVTNGSRDFSNAKMKVSSASLTHNVGESAKLLTVFAEV